MNKKAIGAVLFLILIAIASNVAQAEGQYWATIKKHMVEYDKAETIKEHEIAVQAAQKYLDTLSVKQLIVAGRQCSREADANDPGITYCKETLNIVGFFGKQFPKAGGFNNLDLVFKEIEDKNQTNLWRSVLIDLLDSNHWVKLLTDEQMYAVSDAMLPIFADKTEPFEIRCEASQTIRHLLGYLERRNWVNDPVIQEKSENGEELNILEKEISDGKIILSDNYQITQARTLGYYEKYAQILLLVLQESNSEPVLLRDILIGLCDCLEKEIESTTQIRDALVSTVRNYTKFSSDEWCHLARIGTRTLELPDAELIIKKMLSDSKEMYEKEHNEGSQKKIELRIKELEGILKK